MATDLFSGLGGLMKGLSGIIPQDDPAVKSLTKQSELSDLKAQEKELLAQIGEQALSNWGEAAFPDIAPRLRLVRQDIAAREEELNAAKARQEAEERAKKEAEAKRTCGNCGTVNPDGVKFCQECGTRLGAPVKQLCPQCGAENAPGTRFCGECGARLQ